MKKVTKEINGEKKNVLVVEFTKNLEIYGVREKAVQRKDGTWTKLKQASSNYGLVTISDSLFDAIQSGKYPEDDKAYITLNYFGIKGTGESAFSDI